MTQIATAKNLAFIIHTSISEVAALKDRAEFARMLVSIGESAFAQRRWDELAQVGNALAKSSLPAHHRAIGAYYTGLALSPFSRGDLERALPAFEHAAENASPVFQSRALLGLGAMAAHIGDRTTEAGFYQEAIKRATRDDSRDIYTVIHARRGIAIVRSLEGNHRRALDELEQLWPMVRVIAAHDPVTYLDWLNSLAVELGEVGQVEHARNAARIVTASPVASAYPEWQETADDLAAMQSQAIIISVPEVEQQPEPKQEALPKRSPEPLSSTYRLRFLATRKPLPAWLLYISPVPINNILARYVKRARTRAPDMP